MISYYEYVANQCRDEAIPLVCSFCNTKDELLHKAQEGADGNKGIFGQGWLIAGAISCINDRSAFNLESMNKDALIVHKRCFIRLMKMRDESRDRIDVDRDFMFDVLVELNWLLGSMEQSIEKSRSSIILMSDMTACRDSLRNALLDIYSSAVEDHNECVYIDEALEARKRFFTRRYPFHFEGSKKYLSPDYQTSTIEGWRSEYQIRNIEKMALFLGLTITAAKAEEIRGCQDESFPT